MDNHTIFVKARCAFKTKKGRCKRMTVITHPYCAVHTKQELGLVVATSQIKLAGLGLYTTKKIKKGTDIIEYDGERISTGKYNKRYEKEDYGAYGMTVNKRVAIDARKTSSGLGRYVCDYTGSGKKPNTEYLEDKGIVYITAKRDIEPGEELLVDYGREIRVAMGIEPKKKSKKKKKVIYVHLCQEFRVKNIFYLFPFFRHSMESIKQVRKY
ncbi:MAG: SET domain-containing protein [Cytophagaceae bacterium]|nr:SET domain-containing protein [Cytophagaceae bacterium]